MGSTSEPLFSWLHLSDIHFGHGSATEREHRRLVLDQLLRDLHKAEQWGAPKPDAVLVTGDIGFSGDAMDRQEYAQASSWLRRLAERLEIAPYAIHLVPGNHDVSRARKEDGRIFELLQELRGGTRRLDDVLDEADARELLAGRMKRYRELVAQLSPQASGGEPQDALAWSRSLKVREGLRLRLVGLNTALLANDDQDRGQLRLGLRQLGRASQDSITDELVIALAHHPLAWLGDGPQVEGWLESRVDILLCGHLHEQGSVSTQRSGGRRSVHIASGALHEVPAPGELPVRFAFNFGGVYPGPDGKLQLRVWPFVWTKRYEFRPDSDHLREPGKYYATHDLETPAPAGVGAQEEPGARRGPGEQRSGTAGPTVDPRHQPRPGGALGANEPVYIPRPADEEARDAALQHAATVVIKAPWRMGKSSLLLRYLAECHRSGKRTALMDFSVFEEEVLADYPTLLSFLAERLLRELRLPREPRPAIRSQMEMTYFVEDRILSAISEPLVLAFDQVDRILGKSYQQGFFSMLRNWHNERAREPPTAWARLGTALVISTEPYLLIPSADLSPFNVSSPIELSPFGTDESRELNRRYGNLLTEEQVEGS